jgi:hypothetical protein
VDAMRRNGIDVSARVPLVVGHGPENLRYLATKRDRMGHYLVQSLPGGRSVDESVWSPSALLIGTPATARPRPGVTPNTTG